MLFRPGNLRGVDLAIFDFDFDLTWSAITLTAEGRALHRFGRKDGEDETRDEKLRAMALFLDQSLRSFRHVAAAGLPPLPRRMPEYAEDYPSVSRVGDSGCIHCHHVAEFRRDLRVSQGKWKLEDEFVFPPPEKVGLSFDHVDSSRIVKSVGMAKAVGLQTGDRLLSIGGVSVATSADISYGLHRAPASGTITVAWRRGDRSLSASLSLPSAWKASDLSWRWSLKNFGPAPGFHGDDATEEERKNLGLSVNALAVRTGPFASRSIRQAGLKVGDVVVAVNGGQPKLAGQAVATARQLETYIRLTCRAGDVLRFEVLRDRQSVVIVHRLE